MNNIGKAVAVALAGTILSSFAYAEEQEAVNAVSAKGAGVLQCEVAGGVGLLVGSSKEVNCTYKHADGTVESYIGTMGKLGLDIGVTRKAHLSWVVIPSGGATPGAYALAGNYVGASAGAALGVGVGANALIGGSNKGVVLQPFSAEGTEGLNVAIGVSKLSLQAVAKAEPSSAKKNQRKN